MRSAARSIVLAAAAVVVLAGSGCADGGGRAAPTSLPAESDQRVPGSPSDGYCEGWEAYAATLLAIAAAEGAGQAAELEIVSAAALVAAIEQIGAGWPAELVGERSLVLSDVVGPYLRRAQKALAALGEAGASDEAIRQLSLAWREALSARSARSAGSAGAAGAGAADDPLGWVAALAVPADLRELVDAAAAVFARQVTPFADDPTLPGRRSLVQSADTPRTDGYLAANCPGVGATAAAIQF